MPGRAVAALMALALVAGCAATGDGPVAAADDAAAVERTWSQAYVILPGEEEPVRMADAAPRLRRIGTAMPVVIFAHGCGGYDAQADATLRLLAAHGFAAIAPDHFARPDARSACGTAARPVAPVRSGRRDT
ncbi:dienelactone hydrolase family protein, partial [Falsiroseomonas oryzae]|uniref:dienelactone hydrolase family protein n=1 Tax=Falsiroseomonas oryzae TaxID=2766473 RepID=UPI0022EB3790